MFRKSLLQTTLSFLLIQSFIHTANQNVLKVERGVSNLLIGHTKLQLKSKQSQDNTDIVEIAGVVFMDTKNLIGKPDYTFCIEKGSFKVIFLAGLTASERNKPLTRIKTKNVGLFGYYRNSEDWNSNSLIAKGDGVNYEINPFLAKLETLKFDAELPFEPFLIEETKEAQEKMLLEITSCNHTRLVVSENGKITSINMEEQNKRVLRFNFSFSGNLSFSVNPFGCVMRPVNDLALQEALEKLCSKNAASKEGEVPVLQGNPSVTGDSGENSGEPKKGNSVDGKNGSFILKPIFYIPLLLGLIILVGLSFYFYSQKKRKYIVAKKKKI